MEPTTGVSKFIVSSHSLLKVFFNKTFHEDDYYTIRVKDKSLYVQGDKLFVEHRGEGDFTISGRSLSRMTRFLKAIEDQPITIQLSDSSTIKITEVLI